MLYPQAIFSIVKLNYFNFFVSCFPFESGIIYKTMKISSMTLKRTQDFAKTDSWKFHKQYLKENSIEEPFKDGISSEHSDIQTPFWMLEHKPEEGAPNRLG